MYRDENLDRHAWQYKSYRSITSWTVFRWQRHVKIHGGGKVHQLSPVVSNGICNAFSCSLLTTAKVSIEDGEKKKHKGDMINSRALHFQLQSSLEKSKLCFNGNDANQKELLLQAYFLCKHKIISVTLVKRQL